MEAQLNAVANTLEGTPVTLAVAHLRSRLSDLISETGPSTSFTALYHMAVLLEGLGHRTMALRFISVALLRANPDFVTVVCCAEYAAATDRLCGLLSAALADLDSERATHEAARGRAPDPATLRRNAFASVPFVQPASRRCSAVDAPGGGGVDPPSPAPAAPGALVDEVRALEALLLHDLPPEAAHSPGPRPRSWAQGVEAVKARRFMDAILHFAHSPTPWPMPFQKLLPLPATSESRTWAVAWAVLEAQRHGIGARYILRSLRAAGARPRQQPGPRSKWPAPARSMPLLGQAGRAAAVKAPLLKPTLGENVRKSAGGRPYFREYFQTTKTRPVPDLQCPALSRLVSAAAAGPRTLYVDVNADPNRQTGSRLHPFCEVSHALRACYEGDTILLLPGRYPYLHVTGVHCAYDRPVTIRGVAEDTVLVGPQQRRVPLVLRKRAARVALRVTDCTNVTVSHMTLTNASFAVRVGSDCAYVRLAHLAIQDTSHALDLPDPVNHCIALVDVTVMRPRRYLAVHCAASRRMTSACPPLRLHVAWARPARALHAPCTLCACPCAHAFRTSLVCQFCMSVCTCRVPRGGRPGPVLVCDTPQPAPPPPLSFER